MGIFTKEFDFAWISDGEYREVISNTYHEAVTCLSCKAYKASQVLLGSLLEGVLHYALKRIRIEMPKESTLANLITMSQQNGILTTAHAHISQAIRDYRNLIHPDKQVSEKRRLNQEDTHLMKQATEYVMEEIRKNLSSYVPTQTKALLLLQGSSIEIKKAPFTIGRKEDNSYVANNMNVSKNHARITFDKGGFFLEDFSSNGTYLTPASSKKTIRIKKSTRLGCQDEIRLGKEPDDPTFIFLIPGEERTFTEK